MTDKDVERKDERKDERRSAEIDDDDEDINIFTVIKTYIRNRIRDVVYYFFGPCIDRAEQMVEMGSEFAEYNPQGFKIAVVTVPLLIFLVFSVWVLDVSGASHQIRMRDSCPAVVVQGAQYRYLMDHGCTFGPKTQALWGAGQEYYKQLSKPGGRLLDLNVMGGGGNAAENMVGRCLILAIMGADELFLKRLNDLRVLSGCVVMAYVDYKALPVTKLLAKKYPEDIFIKSFGAKWSSLDKEFADIVKVLKPSNVVAILDGSQREVSILNGFKYSLNSGRLDLILWEHDPLQNTQAHQLRDGVELMVTEGYAVYMASGVLDRGAGVAREDVDIPMGPYLRIDGKLWDDSYMNPLHGNVTLAMVAVPRGARFNQRIQASETLCRARDPFRALSRSLNAEKGWTETTNTHELFNKMADVVEERHHAGSSKEAVDGVCECQGVLFEPAPRYCGVFAPPPPTPDNFMGYALWLEEKQLEEDHAPRRIFHPPPPDRYMEYDKAAPPPDYVF